MTGPKMKMERRHRIFPLYFRTPCTNERDRVFKMTRHQFPVRLTYCMSINKAQGQTLSKVGLYLPNPVFAHGQLYVAMSRVSRPENITVYITNEIPDKADRIQKRTHGDYRGNMYTKNICYQQLLMKEIEKFKNSSAYKGENFFSKGNKSKILFGLIVKILFLFYCFFC